ncbi:MAG: hypothetical protein HY693_02665 [Deltaproteobacteria bacterium]|nr:hypothetical protein [Deltaproteobacteria bacterium]
MKISMITIIISFVALMLLDPSARSSSYNKQMIDHPEWYINITDWNIYSTWSAVAIIHNVTIENTSDIPYKDVMVRVRYYETAAPRAGTQIAQETGVLPVVLPPNSKDTYLKGGSTLGMASMSMYPKEIEVLGAIPILQ